jgi:transcriptional regulator with XRE-family HTH domain
MDDDAGTFGRLLRRFRASAGLSQEALAARSGLSRDAISMLERGVRSAPRPSTVRLLAGALRLRQLDREALDAVAQESAARRRRPAATPRELPRPASDFTGRQAELALLEQLLCPSQGGAAACLIEGRGGVGKSALAVHAAHRLAFAFPDGQIHLDLHGTAAGRPPVDPLDALARMLRSLGMDACSIPADLEEASARFRSLVAPRRLLVVLDDAASAEQVRPLLPGSPRCGALITTRRLRGTLEGARTLSLDALSTAQALEPFGRTTPCAPGPPRYRLGVGRGCRRDHDSRDS